MIYFQKEKENKAQLYQTEEQNNALPFRTIISSHFPFFESDKKNYELKAE